MLPIHDRPVSNLPDLADLWERFRGPSCGDPLSEEGSGLANSGHELTWTSGYLDASIAPTDVRTRRTLESFGCEWSTFDNIRPEDSAFWKRYFIDVPAEAFSNKVALDAGCGKGRFADFAAPLVKNLVALDGSVPVMAAAKNLEMFDNCVVVKADIARMPLAPASFDFIWCLGVLHHLVDPEEGFRELDARLAPGGYLLIHVYSRASEKGVRAAGLKIAAALRRVTVKLPHPVLRALSVPLASLLYLTFVLPGRLGDATSLKPLARLPLQTYRGRPLRSLWLDTFDRLSAPIEKRYLWHEIEPWFQAAGLDVQAVREDAGLVVLARKP